MQIHLKRMHALKVYLVLNLSQAVYLEEQYQLHQVEASSEEQLAFLKDSEQQVKDLDKEEQLEGLVMGLKDLN